MPPLDSILLAGMAGDDTITANGFPDGTSVVELGGDGADTLTGGTSEDVLVDGDRRIRRHLLARAPATTR